MVCPLPRPGLIRRVTNGLFVTADRIRNAVFWGLYRAAEASPWTRMAHRDSEQHERRIDQLEQDVARLTRVVRTCVGCIEGLAELTEQPGDLPPKSLAPRCWCGLPLGHELEWVAEILAAPADNLACSIPADPQEFNPRRPFSWSAVDELLSHGLLARCLLVPRRARAPPAATSAAPAAGNASHPPASGQPPRGGHSRHQPASREAGSRSRRQDHACPRTYVPRPWMLSIRPRSRRTAMARLIVPTAAS